MIEAASARGIHLTSKSTPLEPQDFVKHDFIVAMEPTIMKGIKVSIDYFFVWHFGVCVAFLRSLTSVLWLVCLVRRGFA